MIQIAGLYNPLFAVICITILASVFAGIVHADVDACRAAAKGALVRVFFEIQLLTEEFSVSL